MSTLIDVATYLDAQLSTLTVGSNLFVGRMPESPDTCVTLFEYGGASPTDTLGGGLPVMENPRIQVMTRGATYAATETMARSVWTVLEAIQNSTLSGTRYQRMSAIQGPFPLERDTQDRIVFVQNYVVTRVFS